MNKPQINTESAIARDVTAIIGANGIVQYGNWNLATDADHVGGLGDVSTGRGAEDRGDTQHVDIAPGYIPVKLKVAVKLTGDTNAV